MLVCCLNNDVANGLLEEKRLPGNSTLFSENSAKKCMHGSPCLPAKDTSSDEKKTGKKNGKLKDKRLDAESYCGPRHKARQRNIGV